MTEKRLKIGIIGAGFSGTVLAATLDRLKAAPLDIFLCEKTNCFGPGEAYRTRLPYHLLNVQAKDMSAFEEDPYHFLNWLLSISPSAPYIDPALPLSHQYVSRALYGDYLQAILHQITHQPHSTTTLHCIPSEVIDVIEGGEGATLIFANGEQQLVDKVIFATGNQAPAKLPFSFSSPLSYIANPWDHHLLDDVPQKGNVLIIGTGLSMVDVVLTLHHKQHQGKIYAISRRGLLPLPHSENNASYFLDHRALPSQLRHLTKFLRAEGCALQQQHGEWQAVMRAVRHHVPHIWSNLSLIDKKKFLRHLLPYWNVHRHRIPIKTLHFLQALLLKQQFFLYAGRVVEVTNNVATIQLRSEREIKKLSINSIINCMGPTLTCSNEQPLIQKLIKRGIVLLDELGLGFKLASDGALMTRHKKSTIFYALGTPAKELLWECNAVPEIRRYCLNLAKTILT